MKVELSPGETLLVTYEDTDGEVQVTFSKVATEVRVDGRIVHVYPLAVDGDGRIVHVHPFAVAIDGNDVPLRADNVEDTFMPDEAMDEAMDEEPAFPNGACLARREQDEWACATCGIRWAVDEDRPDTAQCAARSKQ